MQNRGIILRPGHQGQALQNMIFPDYPVSYNCDTLPPRLTHLRARTLDVTRRVPGSVMKIL